ncbi:MAG TPA: signal recognition particle protein [Phycisphaerales bacterium]|jgi:signal recognition particle subunit SRP54|nr:signal recognition particle protein [Phycisphaerales bacterium]
MFENLSDRFGSIFRNLSGRGRIDELNVQDAMREVRAALLEADVHVDVVKQFTDDVLKEAVGRDVTKSLKPGQEMVGIVHQKLVDLMGPVDPSIMMVDPGPTVIMMCGLQGSGKTTTCGKLAAYLKARGKNVMVAAADLQRPAAVEQLKIVVEGVQANARGNARVSFYGEPDKVAEYGKAVGVAVLVCQRALKAAREQKADVLILDTAGRLHVNNELMGELEAVNRALTPHQIYLVVDAMAGQDAINAAKAFHARLNIDGVILTKFDSDTRGGAALSVKTVTGAPIKFIGVGEKYDALEEFHAERMAGRILGMGDVVALVEKAQQEVSEEEAARMAEKMASGKLSMDDFLKQLRSIRRMGPMKQLLGLLPGVGSMLKNVEVDDKQLDRLEGIVHSMTPKERDDLSVLNKSRIKRIATGSGTKADEVNKLVKQFEMISKLTQQMSGLGAMGKIKAMKELQKMDPNMVPGMRGMPGIGGARGSTATQSVKTKFKQRKKR